MYDSRKRMGKREWVGEASLDELNQDLLIQERWILIGLAPLGIYNDSNQSMFE